MKYTILKMNVALMAGILLAPDIAGAQSVYLPKPSGFGQISRNIGESVAGIPGLLTSLSYLIGLILGVLGIFKMKDHVEAPESTSMKGGAVRLATGGALFALPIIFEAMRETVGTTASLMNAAQVNAVKFNVK